MRPRNPIIENFKLLMRTNPTLKWLLIVNISMMLLIWFSMLVGAAMGSAEAVAAAYSRNLAVNSNTDILLRHFWTPITYMFVHNPHDLFHLLSNMLILVFSGDIFTKLMGQRKLMAMYLGAGFFGFLTYALAYNFLPTFEVVNAIGAHHLLGASGAVLGVLVGSAFYAPNIELMLFGVVRMAYKWVAILLLVMVFSGSWISNAGGQLAHLGGALFGLVTVWSIKNKRNWLLPFEAIVYYIGSIFKPKQKIRVEYRNPNKKRTQSKQQTKQTSQRQTSSSKPASDAEHQKRIDQILDKISKSGYESLSKADKEYLFHNSQRN